MREGKDVIFMRMALEEARLAMEAGEVPVGAIVVRGGKVIARAHNGVEAARDATSHAELIALREAARHKGEWRLSDCTMYVTLEPCAMCAGAMVNAKLGRLVFGAHEEATGCCGSVLDILDGLFLHTVECCGGVLECECRSLMAEFFRARRGL